MKKPDPPVEGKRRLAVALEYSGKGAPKVTAKGGGEMAEAILELARQHDVPVTQNKELVTLLAGLELGQEIPESLYLAVAEVIAFAYWLRGKTPGT